MNMFFNKINIIYLTVLVLLVSSCEKFVDPGLPVTALLDEVVFKKETTATAALVAIYTDLLTVTADGTNTTQNLSTALAADEQRLTGSNPLITQIYSNSVSPDNTSTALIWDRSWTAIYKANAVLEGIAKYGAAIPEDSRNQLNGEAKFLRAYLYYYLVNLYGDLPIITGTNYEQNRLASRKPVAEVYQQIITDLKEARELVRNEYVTGYNVNTTTSRIRANKAAVTALLARVYLYTGDWNNAEDEASKLIDNTLAPGKMPSYSLPALTGVFLKNNNEAIFQIQHSTLVSITPGYATFFATVNPLSTLAVGNNSVLSNSQLALFEPGDGRRTTWVKSFTGTEVFNFSAKYITGGTQFQTVIRLSELYLIRAESRIMRNNIDNGIADLNVLRTRAREAATVPVPDPLPAIPKGLSAKNAMLALEKERQLELFTEGHRWFDLKRWKGFDNTAISRADEVMPAVTTLKGAKWSVNSKLWPISLIDMRSNVNFTQNPGYGN